MQPLGERLAMVVEHSDLLAMEVRSVLEGAGAAALGPFATVVGTRALPPEFAGVVRVEKPVNARRLVNAVQACCRNPPMRD